MAAGGTILVIDDEPMVRRFLCTALEETGLEVRGAGGGAEARRICAESGEPIRFVLLDLSLPDADAGELFAELTTPGSRASEARWVLTSGYGEAEARARFGREGLDGFLAKPFRVDTLLDLAEALLGLGR